MLLSSPFHCHSNSPSTLSSPLRPNLPTNPFRRGPIMTPGLHAADLRRIFHQLDRNGDGLLSIDELGWLLDRIGSSSLQFTSDELESSVGKSTLDFDEFLAFYRSIEDGGGGGESGTSVAAAVERDLEEAFRVFDLNGDGFITSEELQKVLSRLGLWDETTGKDCRRMISPYDTNLDGVLDFDEFKNMMRETTSS
ncbi:unnamed protein product [Linum tenue]|uniref:EF-hand domain-containing protein n=2 Tax=Linum tenue TaxID=586396 RepID=A0AAV0RWF7_9ROSI|nr:unnamed protein product [Linum tenue]